MSSRSDRLSRAAATPEVHSDVDVAFMLNPVTGGISRLANEAACAQAIRLTLLTYNEEWPFEPDNGTMIPRSLFEPSDGVSLTIMSDTISNAVRNRCSAYAELVGVQVRPRQDPRIVDVLVGFREVASGVESTVRVVLRRVR